MRICLSIPDMFARVRLRVPLASATLLRVSLLALRAVSSTSTPAMGNKGLNKGEVPLYTATPEPKVKFSEEELRQRLSAEEYRITQEKGTEGAGTGPHLKVSEDGLFTCVVCGNHLFQTDAKFDSGSGWPSFYDVAHKSDSVVRVVDKSQGMVRTEVICGQCGAHLGHVFDDGPTDKRGLRYCINGACLKFSASEGGQNSVEKSEEEDEEKASDPVKP